MSTTALPVPGSSPPARAPRGPEGLRPADLERRLHAYALDRVLGWGLPVGLAWLLVASDQAAWLVLSAPLALAVVLVAGGAALLAARGATPGMAALGLRVEPVDGPLSFAAAVRRQAVLALAGPPTFGLGLATLAWTAAADVSGRRRGWHDEVAGTQVVDVRPVAAPEAVPERPQPIVNLTAMRLVPPEPAPATPRPATGTPDGQSGAPVRLEAPEAPARPDGPAPGRRRADVPPATRGPAIPPATPPATPPAVPPATPPTAAPPPPAVATPRWRATADTGEQVVVRGLTLLGRGPQARPGEQVADLVALESQDMSVSKTHAQLSLGADGSLVVMDRGSTNGSVLIRQGVPRHLSPGRPVTLLAGDVLRLGDRALEIEQVG